MSMAGAGRRPRARGLERAVHRSLLGGLLASGLLLVAGLAIVLATGEQRGAGPPPPFATLLAGAAAGRGVAIVDVGLLILMLTPALRVAVLGFGWARARELRFALVAASVLALLVVSVLLGVG
jgi:hypothetical protein